MLDGHTNIINTVEFNRDGDLVLSSSDDKTVKIFELKKGTMLK